ncbi:MAG: glycine--tRNA ligase [Candidatus Heimdallarchaeota archaeon]|nr:glycine--tRNA ligase [Candidatus Heimdallarchaeota archaeon]MDH5645708.1 glycine--tRNA ligase [Candidatus Heimdallarchaeota archaeon]
MKKKSLQEDIVDVCLRRGIIFPSAEIYNGPSGFYEFGPVGESIRQNIIQLWQEAFVNAENNVYEISGSTILPENVFEASGHLESFNDPLTQCEGCKSMFRADHIIEEQVGINVDGKSLAELFDIIKEKNIVCNTCKGVLTMPREFNMMFSTTIGPVSDKTGYLRPETAQNIFLNFRRISHSMRAKLPFGVAQIGKAYRNEISPRNFLIRLREFEQMEIEMFVDPDEINNHTYWDDIKDFEVRILTREAQQKNGKPKKMTLEQGITDKIIHNQYMAYYMFKESLFVQDLGISEDQFWFRHLLENQTAHYSKANYDLEIQFPFGIVECIGLAYRTDYDLIKHAEKSKTNMQINVPGKGNIVPHVIEPSFGLNRLVYAVLLNSYISEGREWTWFKFPKSIAPWEALITPLMKKDGMDETAENLYWDLKDQGIDAIYDNSGNIGKRYARNDEVGVPFCITVDYDTLKDETVTIRDRDTTEQIRVSMDEVGSIIRELILEIITWEEIKEETEVLNENTE